jgi:biotin carboxylase
VTPATVLSDLPLIAIGYGPRCVSPIFLAEAATGLCDLLWLVDATIVEMAEMMPLLRRFGPVIDVAEFDVPGLEIEIGRYNPAGMVTYLDARMVEFATLAERLGVLFHSPRVATALVDKVAQRKCLNEAEFDVPTCVVLPNGSAQQAVASVASELSWPAVLKPRSAQGSLHTFLANDASDAIRLLDALGPDREEMILEDYLESDPTRGSGLYADYVSVESIVTGDTISHIAVTGRFPLAENFRETGFFIPAALSQGDEDDVLREVTRAIKALGVRAGCLHTEVKFTPVGPRIIEVNGRIGGGVAEMLVRAAGVPLLELTLRVALGEQVQVHGPVPTTSIGYRLFLQPPAMSATIDAIEGLDQITEYPGVDIVSIHKVPGADLDWRDGSRNYLIAVVGTAHDLEELTAVNRLLREKVTASYTKHSQ